MITPRSRHFASAALGLFAFAAVTPARAVGPIPADVITYHNDAAVTGQYRYEQVLSHDNVAPAAFGKRFDFPLDGQVYAQPLYVAGLVFGDGRHNVVFVATEHDSVYAIDADTGKQLWKSSFLVNNRPGIVYSTVSNSELPGQCGQITPELGVTATPAIDLASNTIYLAAMTKETSDNGSTVNYFQRIHALDLTTGLPKPGSAVAVEAAVPGTGDGGTTVVFNPLYYKARPGLVLVNGVLYTSWSSHCDRTPYHGWIIGYDAKTLQRTTVFNVTPDGTEASFWTGGAAPAVDSAGNLFIGSANGSFNMQNSDGTMNTSGRNLGESFLRLTTTGGHLKAADWFTPYNFEDLDENDQDVGSAGIILYDVNGAHLAASAGKEGRIYILNRNSLGHFSPNTDTGAVQSVPEGSTGLSGAVFGCPAFFQSAANGPTLYFSGSHDHLRAFVLDPETGKLTGGANSQTSETFTFPGTAPSLSSRAGENGIVWVMDSTATLRAYNADNLGQELYNTTQAANGRDTLGSYVKFTTPTVAQSQVFAGTVDHLGVYGLLKPAVPANATPLVSVQVLSTKTAGDTVTQQIKLTNNGTTPLGPPLSLVFDGLDAAATVSNATGTTAYTSPRANFYLNATLSGKPLGLGVSAMLTVEFAVPGGAAPNFTPRVLAGGGPR